MALFTSFARLLKMKNFLSAGSLRELHFEDENLFIYRDERSLQNVSTVVNNFAPRFLLQLLSVCFKMLVFAELERLEHVRHLVLLMLILKSFCLFAIQLNFCKMGEFIQNFLMQNYENIFGKLQFEAS